VNILKMKSVQTNLFTSDFIPSPYKAAVSISFDFETSAQTARPPFRTRGKSYLYDITNYLGLTNKDLSAGAGRGYGNRVGAEKILKIFEQHDIKATWFSTGHVLLKQNKNRDAFRINQKLPYALKKAGFTEATTWRVDEKSFYHEPFSDYKKYPYYYLGDLAEKLKKQGHDMQCHSFSHPYISMELLENIRIDLEDWQNTAEREGFARSNIFAFPFLGDYHYIEKTNGIKTIPAFRNPEIAYKISSLEKDVLKIFKNNGFKLFTRCGSMHDSELIQGFREYRNSGIYWMKDKELLSFPELGSFQGFLEELIQKNANIDLWLHPNDIMEDYKYILFKSYIEQLVKYQDKGIIWISSISEQWRRFKEFENQIIKN
jgi:peptidoglycan/xylan/chitin deacetylase (PgdA/CDA1 family)